MHLKNCKEEKCGKIFLTEYEQTQRCPDCRRARRKMLQLKWVASHKEHIREYNNRWYVAQIHAQESAAIIRREHLRGVSEKDTIRAQNKELAEIIEKLLNFTPESQFTIDIKKLREKIEEIKNPSKKTLRQRGIDTTSSHSTNDEFARMQKVTCILE
jgi:hypothetical protein